MRTQAREQRAESREQRAESREQRAESREQRAESRQIEKQRNRNTEELDHVDANLLLECLSCVTCGDKTPW
jgi:hypothetical protein